jgi:hypothetical protein
LPVKPVFWQGKLKRGGNFWKIWICRLILWSTGVLGMERAANVMHFFLRFSMREVIKKFTKKF